VLHIEKKIDTQKDERQKQIPYTVTEYRTEQKQQPYYVTIQEPHQKRCIHGVHHPAAHSADPSEEGAQGSSAEDPHRIQDHQDQRLREAACEEDAAAREEEQLLLRDNLLVRVTFLRF